MAEGLIGIEISQYGLKRLLRRLDPNRVIQERNRALSKAARHVKKAILGQSRVRTGAYKASWRTVRPSEESRAIVNPIAYAEFVTGNTMRRTRQFGGRRGAGEAFMRKIRRENSMAVRKIMQEMIREVVRG